MLIDLSLKDRDLRFLFSRHLPIRQNPHSGFTDHACDRGHLECVDCLIVFTDAPVTVRVREVNRWLLLVDDLEVIPDESLQKLLAVISTDSAADFVSDAGVRFGLAATCSARLR